MTDLVQRSLTDEEIDKDRENLADFEGEAREVPTEELSGVPEGYRADCSEK